MTSDEQAANVLRARKKVVFDDMVAREEADGDTTNDDTENGLTRSERLTVMEVVGEINYRLQGRGRARAIADDAIEDDVIVDYRSREAYKEVQKAGDEAGKAEEGDAAAKKQAAADAAKAKFDEIVAASSDAAKGTDVSSPEEESMAPVSGE